MIHLIYSIVSKINGKKYIGQTINFLHRKNTHLSLLRRNKHDNKKLQNTFNKYGEQNFDFNIILVDVSSDEIDNIEKFVIKEFDTYKSGYNMDLGGYDKSNLGTKFVYNGEEYQSINKTAKELNIHPNTLDRRIKKGYVDNFEFGTKPSLWIKCSWNGIEYPSIVSAAKALGITRTTMGDRIKKGYTCDSDLGIWYTGQQIEIDGIKYNSIKEASEKLKISRRTIKKRYLND